MTTFAAAQSRLSSFDRIFAGFELGVVCHCQLYPAVQAFGRNLQFHVIANSTELFLDGTANNFRQRNAGHPHLILGIHFLRRKGVHARLDIELIRNHCQLLAI